jgi:hypothetical protein
MKKKKMTILLIATIAVQIIATSILGWALIAAIANMTS